MKNADKPAYPYAGSGHSDTIGLTKREKIAAMAMQGILANPHVVFDDKMVAKESILYADELLKQLEGEK